MHEHNLNDEQLQQEDLLNLDDVMRTFGIQAWQNLGPVEPSYTESVHLLVDIQGERYVLKERAEGLVGEDLSHRYDFQHYLQQAGIPIPDVWLTPQGKPAVEIGDDIFELQRWAGGERFATANPRSLDWVEYAGTMLGRIHRASQHYQGGQHRWPSEVQIGSLVQSCLQLARTRADAYEIQDIASALFNWADTWEIVLPASMMAIGTGKGLPEFHIHGDYHPLNLRFGTFGVTAVLGLEASRWEKRIFELAYSLFYFSALTWQADSGVTRPLVKRGVSPERARRFLQGYGEVYPPVQGESDLLIDALMLVSPIAIMNGPLEDLFYAQQKPEELVVSEVMERLSWAISLPAWFNRVRRSLPDMWQ